MRERKVKRLTLPLFDYLDLFRASSKGHEKKKENRNSEIHSVLSSSSIGVPVKCIREREMHVVTHRQRTGMGMEGAASIRSASASMKDEWNRARCVSIIRYSGLRPKDGVCGRVCVGPTGIENDMFGSEADVKLLAVAFCFFLPTFSQ
jgi:hypothetical protein